MGLDGFHSCSGKSRCRILLSRRIGKIEAQLLMVIDRNRFGGLDDLEGQSRSGQAEYRARAAVAFGECGAQWQADQVTVKPDG